MVMFSAGTYGSGYQAPQRFEADVYDCEVTGQIPRELDGAFYRVHGDWFYPPKYADEAYISPEGYFSMFRIKNGMCDYKGRWVRNERFNNLLSARRQLYGYYRNTYTDEPEVQDHDNPHFRTTSNTSPVVLGGKLYATKEDGLAYEMDPNTLATLGPSDFGGQWQSQTFTAHPRWDPDSGETIAYGYEASGSASKDVFLAIFDARGKMLRSMRFDAPYVTMLHDMCITKDYVILPGGGLVTSVERLKEGKVHWGWNGKLPSLYGVVRRDGDGSDVRWFKGPPRAIIHTANAYQQGNKLILEGPLADSNYWSCFPDVEGSEWAPTKFLFRRITFDMSSTSDECVEEIIFPGHAVTGFARIDDRFTGKDYRYIYSQLHDSTVSWDAKASKPVGPLNNTLARFDRHDGSVTTFSAGHTHTFQEPAFVPRTANGAEGDGWLLAVANNLLERRSELLIVDAITMTETARVVLPFRSANQIHAMWADTSMVPLGPLAGQGR